jgi:hypothetical protein
MGCLQKQKLDEEAKKQAEIDALQKQLQELRHMTKVSKGFLDTI